MLTSLFKKEAKFIYNTEQMQNIAKGIEDIMLDSMQVRSDYKKLMKATTFAVDLLFRIREYNVPVFDECVTKEDIEKLKDI